MASRLNASQQALYDKYIANAPEGFDGHSKSAILKHLVQNHDEAGLSDALLLWLQGKLVVDIQNWSSAKSKPKTQAKPRQGGYRDESFKSRRDPPGRNSSEFGYVRRVSNTAAMARALSALNHRSRASNGSNVRGSGMAGTARSAAAPRQAGRGRGKPTAAAAQPQRPHMNGAASGGASAPSTQTRKSGAAVPPTVSGVWSRPLQMSLKVQEEQAAAAAAAAAAQRKAAAEAAKKQAAAKAQQAASSKPKKQQQQQSKASAAPAASAPKAAAKPKNTKPTLAEMMSKGKFLPSEAEQKAMAEAKAAAEKKAKEEAAAKKAADEAKAAQQKAEAAAKKAADDAAAAKAAADKKAKEEAEAKAAADAAAAAKKAEEEAAAKAAAAAQQAAAAPPATSGLGNLGVSGTSAWGTSNGASTQWGFGVPAEEVSSGPKMNFGNVARLASAEEFSFGVVDTEPEQEEEAPPAPAAEPASSAADIEAQLQKEAAAASTAAPAQAAPVQSFATAAAAATADSTHTSAAGGVDMQGQMATQPGAYPPAHGMAPPPGMEQAAGYVMPPMAMGDQSQFMGGYNMHPHGMMPMQQQPMPQGQMQQPQKAQGGQQQGQQQAPPQMSQGYPMAAYGQMGTQGMQPGMDASMMGYGFVQQPGYYPAPFQGGNYGQPQGFPYGNFGAAPNGFAQQRGMQQPQQQQQQPQQQQQQPRVSQAQAAPQGQGQGAPMAFQAPFSNGHFGMQPQMAFPGGNMNFASGFPTDMAYGMPQNAGPDSFMWGQQQARGQGQF